MPTDPAPRPKIAIEMRNGTAILNGAAILECVGSGERAYLWIGSTREFYGSIDNSAKLRRFLADALEKMKTKPRRKR